jgi:ABC-2 type transport system permease protein
MTMRTIRLYGRAMFLAFEMTLRQNFTDMFVLFGIFVQPLIIALLAFWMLQERGGDYIIFVVVGSGMTGLWTTVLFSSGGNITRERWTGTLELLVGAPAPIQVIIFGKNLADVLQSLGSMLLSYTLAIFIFGQIPKIEQPGLFAVSLIIAVISYVCFGLIVSPVFVMNPNVQRIQNGLEFPIYILSGFLFPIALLPNWTTPLSYILAPYWAARALHATSSGGADFREIALSWGMMILFSLIYLVAASKLFKTLLYKARVEATLIRQ